LNARLSHLKRYQPRFFGLPFEAQPGSESMLTALDVARRLDSGALKTLPADAPLMFVASNLRTPLRDVKGSPKQGTWEIALGLAVRRWAGEREQGYARLLLSSEAQPALQHLELELGRVAGQARDDLSANPFASVHSGRFKFKRPDALEIPD